MWEDAEQHALEALRSLRRMETGLPDWGVLGSSEALRWPELCQRYAALLAATIPSWSQHSSAPSVLARPNSACQHRAHHICERR